MAALSFSAQIDDWVRETQARAEAVFKTSAQRIEDEMQTPVGGGGHMPVDTGFLRSSILGSTNSMPMIRDDARPQEGQTYTYNRDQIALVIAGAELGQTIYMGYVAAYARHQHYGSNGRPGRQWVTLAAQRWPQIVEQVTREAKAVAA